jgi:NAD(P)-dependent dehydrogenase (short-subunit alcohol dehydrogenase family)
MIDMHNKTVVVTGANSGVGFVTAKQLAEAGAEIVMVCRDPARGETARAQIVEIAAGPAPQLFIADLSSQAEIRDLARDIHLAYDRIDVLLNNAGSVFNKGARRVDGIEKTFATNHLAPFLLTNLLQDQLLAAPAARVVTVATEIYSRKLDFENLQGERSYNFFKAYLSPARRAGLHAPNRRVAHWPGRVPAGCARPRSRPRRHECRPELVVQR